jgi:hypothetical protein
MAMNGNEEDVWSRGGDQAKRRQEGITLWCGQFIDIGNEGPQQLVQPSDG